MFYYYVLEWLLFSFSKKNKQQNILFGQVFCLDLLDRKTSCFKFFHISTFDFEIFY